MEKGLLMLGGLQAPAGCYGYATLLRYATERLVASRQQPCIAPNHTTPTCCPRCWACPRCLHTTTPPWRPC